MTFPPDRVEASSDLVTLPSVSDDRFELDSNSSPSLESIVAEPLRAEPCIPGYTIVGPLGRGGMAEIWLAERQGSAGVPVRCVVKMVLPEHAGAPKYRERILDEARIVAQLRHPNICSVVDVGQAGDRLYLAMEWVEGLDAAELMRRVRNRRTEIPLRHVLFVIRQALQGLHHAHTATSPDGEPLAIVHRDVTPGNILLSRDGAVKLGDFGVAVGSVAQRIERRGMLAGKLHYFAPELFTPPRQATARSDVFALAVTFYEMLTIEPLFDRKKSTRELRVEIEAFDVERLLEENLTIPDGLEEILRRGLARDPSDRYASALQFLEDVNDFAYETGLRLLGPHFAEYLGRIMTARPEGRRSLAEGIRERGE